MDDAKLRTAVISGNREFREAVSRLLKDFPEMLRVVTDLPVPAGDLDSESLEELHKDDPELIIADFDGDPVASLRYIRLLSDARPSRLFLGAGPELPPKLLIEAMRSGVSEYLPMPVEPRQLDEALRRVGRKLGRGPAAGTSQGGRIVAFAGAKGGTGVTTAAVNAAIHAHALTGRRTLLLDLDLDCGSVGVMTGVTPRYSIRDLVTNLHRLDESLLESLVTEHESGIHILPAPMQRDEAEAIRPEDVRTVLRLIRHHYDVVVVDVARPSTEMARTVLAQADDIYLVLNADLPSLRHAKRIMGELAMSNGHSPERVRVILNRILPNGEQVTVQDIDKALNVPVAFMLRQDDAAVLRSVNVGEPAVANGSRSKYGQDVKRLGLAIARAVDPDVREQSSGILRRLSRKIGSKRSGSGS